MRTIAVSGASGPLGSRLLLRLAADATVARVLALDEPGDTAVVAPPGLEVVPVATGHAVSLKEALAGVDTLVTLDEAPLVVGAARMLRAAAMASPDRLAGLRATLDAAGSAGVDGIVHLSSAVVYGAWPDNPVPLPEDAPVRPDPAFGWAVEQAEAERLVSAWADDHPGARLAVLRPTLVVTPEDEAWLVRAVGGTRGVRTQGESRPVQFLHVDDLAAALALCVARRAEGTFNVAPDGWIEDREAASLAGAGPRPALPVRLAAPARRWAWRLGVGATPPAADAYATNPWVVASDRLRAEGWRPEHSNAEALVATTTPALANLSPRRRQELLLGAAGVAVAAAVVGAGLLARRLWRSGKP